MDRHRTISLDRQFPTPNSCLNGTERACLCVSRWRKQQLMPQGPNLCAFFVSIYKEGRQGFCWILGSWLILNPRLTTHASARS